MIKKISLYICITLMLFCSTFVCVACGDGEAKPISLTYVENSMQETYYTGESVCLSDAKFIIGLDNKKEREIEYDDWDFLTNIHYVQTDIAGKKIITFMYISENYDIVTCDVPVEYIEPTVTDFSIKQSTLPTEVWQGDKIDVEGVQIVATYSNGAEKAINIANNEEVEVVYPEDTSNLHEAEINICFAGITHSVTIEIKTVKIIGMEFSGGVKGTYQLGETFDTSIIIVELIFGNGDTIDVSGSDIEIDTNLNTNVEGNNYYIIATYVGDKYVLENSEIKAGISEVKVEN